MNYGMKVEGAFGGYLTKFGLSLEGRDWSEIYFQPYQAGITSIGSPFS